MNPFRINGKLETARATTVAELLAEHGIDPATRFIAVAVNGAVVRRTEWPTHRLAAGDQIEIVRPLQGG